ncbi:MAG: BlaI/MecI/CopY family transcriptional regulator [Planctomycetota bacterium]|jgi:BlaI family penicillinase repressor
MAEKPNISEAEWVVMEALWDLRRAAAVDVVRQLEGSTSWNHRTIRTLLRRLVEKGFVERVKVDGRSQYQPAKRRRSCVRSEGQTFLDRVFRGDACSLLLHFGREARLSPEKLRQLRQMLDEDQPE